MEDFSRKYNLSDEELFSRINNDELASERITAPRYSYWKSVFRVFFRKKINVAVTLFYILFSLARPDYHIARYNLRHYEDVDIEYIFSLSSDAIPALEEAGVLEKREWETEEGSWKKYYINDRLEKIQETYEEMGIRDFNFSYQLAGKILEWRIPAQEEGNAPQQ